MERRWVYLAIVILALPYLYAQDDPQAAEAELQSGITLTSQGRFAEAIPHLKAATGKVRQEYAAGFNLALCYVGTNQFGEAIGMLGRLRVSGHDTAEVNNLLAQSYVGSGQTAKAREAFHKAAKLSPENERLYVFVAEACNAHHAYDLETEVVNLGLENLPKSARLHYARGVLLSSLDRSDEARADFQAVAVLAPESDLGYLALSQRSLIEGHVEDAVQQSRRGVEAGHEDYMLLAILGESLIRSGVGPGDAGFAEAKSALEKSISKRPNYPSAQIALGKLLLMENNLDGAIAHLETGRQLEPESTFAYASLIAAYRRKGENQKAAEMTQQLSTLNQHRAEQISGASGDRRAGYGVPR
jgi:tetratricopeptide (TPR) repeat protein